MKILFIRPPRQMWPFHTENSSFWQPLAFASMAAVLRENIDDIDIKIQDCAVQKIGWKSTEKMLEKESPDILCVGDETVSASESLLAARMAKQNNPATKVVAGGVYFSNMMKDTLMNQPVDFIVNGEGEMTLLELVREMKKEDPHFANVKGIAFKFQGKAAKTKPRPLIENLDELPMPAYDLLPMELYGKNAKSHRDFAAIEHSRGCVSNCNFCVLWKQMGAHVSDGSVIPCYRTKSVKKTVEEVLHLYEKYKRKTFCWVDPTWNVDPEWSSNFADAMIEHDINADHSIWARADFVVRDESKGILAKEVKAGINQFMIGLERTDDEELKHLDKNTDFETTRKAFKILKMYPSVLTVATYIYGMPWETPKTMKNFYSNMKKIPFDFGVPLPLTPHPGTRFHEELREDGLLEIEDYDFYNFVNVVARSEKMSRSSLLFHMLLNEVRVRTRKEQFASRNINSIRRKGAVSSLTKVKAKMTARFLWNIMNMSIGREVNLSTKPEWYDD